MAWITFQRFNALEPSQKPRQFILLSTACPSHLQASWVLCPKRESLLMMSKAQQMSLQGYLWALEGRFGSYRFGSCALPGCSCSGLLSLCTIDSCGRMVSCGGLCCALNDVWQHPRLLPPRCQSQPCPQCDNENVYRCCQMLHRGQNHPLRTPVPLASWSTPCWPCSEWPENCFWLA